jgi:hypothetical protein|tara:strand:+ start:1092 stop:1328 length:237 start_codon:yes stop_codon:yes gene_type:complete
MKKEINVEFRLVNDEEMPPIVITMNDRDEPKVVLNSEHKIWLSLYRKTIGGCAEALYEKIEELLSAHLQEQRAYERMD